MKKVITKRPDLEGKRYYPLYRLDKNISWFNIHGYIAGFIYSIITIEWLRDPKVFIIRIIKPGRFWLPPVYAKGYHTIKYE